MSKMLGIFGVSGHYFHVKYNTLYFIFIKCVLCEAVGSADQNHTTFKTFLFFTRNKKQKNLPSAISAKGGFALRRVHKTGRTRKHLLRQPLNKPDHSNTAYIFNLRLSL